MSVAVRRLSLPSPRSPSCFFMSVSRSAVPWPPWLCSSWRILHKQHHLQCSLQPLGAGSACGWVGGRVGVSCSSQPGPPGRRSRVRMHVEKFGFADSSLQRAPCSRYWRLYDHCESKSRKSRCAEQEWEHFSVIRHPFPTSSEKWLREFRSVQTYRLF